MIVVGDSLNRNQWESLACLIYSSIHPSRAMVDAEGPVYKVLKAKVRSSVEDTKKGGLI